MSLECPICLEDPCDDQNKSGVIETNCGHLFCYTHIPKLDLDDHPVEIESQAEEEEEELDTEQNGYVRLMSNDEERCTKQTKMVACFIGTTVSLFIFYVIFAATS